MSNIVDFHVHGIGSRYKDAFATASYDHICAYFQRLAENRHKDVYIAFTEHDCSVISFEQYKALQKKYPKVKIILGMEANVKLTHATDGIFEVAHVLAYADMSSDESVKKWIDCKELKDLSKIKTFQIPYQTPGNVEILERYCKLLDEQYGIKLDVNDVIETCLSKNLRTEHLKRNFENYFVEHVDLSANTVFKGCETPKSILDKLNNLTFLVQDRASYFENLVPSRYNCGSMQTKVEMATRKLEIIGHMYIDRGELWRNVNLFQNDADIDKQFVAFASRKLASNKHFLYKISINKLMNANSIKQLDQSSIESYINSQIFKSTKFSCRKTTSQMFESVSEIENFGDELYIAKSILNKNLGLKITNAEIAELLDHSKTRAKMREHFIRLVQLSIGYKNPELYKKVKNLSWKNFSYYELGYNKHGPITLSKLVPKQERNKANFTKDIRTPLAEINEIVKKTGGHLMLAHPDTVFKYSENEFVPASCFGIEDRKLIDKFKYREINAECINNGGVSTTTLKGSKNGILKLELFFKLCRKNGIKFDGFEITKRALKDREILRNQLIYAAKNNYCVSFGSDAHLSNVHFYYDLLIDGKISHSDFEDLCEYADKIGDNTAELEKYKKYYPNRLHTEARNINFATVKPKYAMVKNNDVGKLYSNNYTVEQTSFSDKLLGKTNNDDVLLTLGYKGEIYSFNKSTLCQMKYDFDKIKDDEMIYDDTNKKFLQK